MTLKVGGYQPIPDVDDDPYVVEIGKFAVAEHNKQANEKLVFVRVVSGEQQIVSGTNYKLVIETKGRDVSKKEYEALVYDKPWDKVRTLTSFKPMSMLKPGGYQPILDVGEAYIVEIGKFAVAEHNMQASEKLVFICVVSGEQQVVSGTNYRLVIEAKDQGVSREYQALVYDRPWDKVRTLTSFKPMSTLTIVVGGYQPIPDVNDPYVVEIGKFAVAEHNIQAGEKLVFVHVVSGEQQVVAGTNYKLIIEVEGRGGSKLYEALVYNRPWDDVRTLTSFKLMSTLKRGRVDGYQPIPDINAPYIVEIGQFAVVQHNQLAEQKLVFVRVVSGEQQVVAGMNYKLVIEANDSGANKEYEALVYDRPWDKVRLLISFKLVLTVKRVRLGGYEPIPDVDAPYIVEIGRFAVAEHNKQAKDNLTFACVVSGDQQVVAGMNYKLVIEAAADYNASKEYEALVYDRPWDKVRALISFKPMLRPT